MSFFEKISINYINAITTVSTQQSHHKTQNTTQLPHPNEPNSTCSKFTPAAVKQININYALTHHNHIHKHTHLLISTLEWCGAFG